MSINIILLVSYAVFIRKMQIKYLKYVCIVFSHTVWLYTVAYNWYNNFGLKQIKFEV